MPNASDPCLDLADQIHRLLLEQPEGYSEYQLIQQLKARQCPHIPPLAMDDRLVLFHTHFLVFNALYQLRQRLITDIHLAISPLNISLQPLPASGTALGEYDPLASYYLNMDNLRQTTGEHVARLLTSFWSRMHGADEHQAALELFELDPLERPLSLIDIKRRYRQLVSLHHPDRGGSNSRLQSINKAMEILNRYYK